MFPNLKEIVQMSITFFITVIAWVFFRADNISEAFNYLLGMLNFDLFKIPNIPIGVNIFSYALFFFLLIIFIIIEWIHRNKKFGFQITSKNRTLNWLFYILVFSSIFLFGGKQQEFIYFQF